MSERTIVEPLSQELAEHVLARSNFDFRQLHGKKGLMLDRPERHGISLIAAVTTELPQEALDAILSWRLGQYLLTGFYDANYVKEHDLMGEPHELVNDFNVHGLAIDEDGGLNTYLTIKQPPTMTIQEKNTPFSAQGRPPFPCEEIHGRSWHTGAVGLDRIQTGDVWEMGRFVTDQRQDRLRGIAARRGPVEIALASARLALHPDFVQKCTLIVGDLDPDVVLQNLRFFYMPVASYEPHIVEVGHDNPLWPRYANTKTSPFLAVLSDIDYATYIRWADVNLALDCSDEEFALRMLAMRQFVSIRESSLKRPNRAPHDSTYPVAALTSSSSLDASSALLYAAEREQIPWHAVSLGPGEPLQRDCITWIVDGFARATIKRPGGPSHLSALGPEIAFVPQEGFVDVIETLEAVTPVRALVTDIAEFERFWRERQQVFDTSTRSLYGDVLA